MRSDEPLLDFVPALSPRFQRPDHLAPVAAVLESTRSREVRSAIHTPPRHGKTELLLHWIIRELRENPSLQIGYSTYSADLANSKSRRALRLAREAGIELATENVSDWQTKAGGGLVSRGVGGGWTGRGLDRLIIDDPVKDRAEAESRTYRERVWDWFTDAAYTRIEPGGSVIVAMARWHPGDLVGRLIDDGWEYLRLPAIADDPADPLGREIGAALWPERCPLVLLRDRMRNDYTAASLYQGRPRPRGGVVFQNAAFYEALPVEGYRVGIGFDMAYTARTHSDWSVIVVMRRVGDLYYIEDVIRVQTTAPLFGARLRAAQGVHRAAARIYYGPGGEQGAIQFMQQQSGASIDPQPATTDKFVRAQPLATAWNESRVLVPRSAKWLDTYLDEMLGFTGVSDDHDDQVDASAAAFDMLAAAGPIEYHSVTTRRYGKSRRGWA